MLNKVSGLARAVYLVLAVVAGFIVLGKIDVALVLVVLGLVSGLSLAKDRMVLAAATIIALPILGTALGHIPTIGAQLAAVMANLQLGMGGAFAMAMAIMMYEVVMEGVTGLTGPEAAPAAKRKAAAAR